MIGRNFDGTSGLCLVVFTPAEKLKGGKSEACELFDVDLIVLILVQ